MVGLFWLIVGTVVFVAITLFEQVPVLGWLGGIISIVAWIALARALGDAPGVVSAGGRATWAGILGAWTGFVGAFTAWLAQTGNLFGFTTPPGDRFGAVFGFLGAALGIFYWPVVGAIVCALAALAATGRRWS